VKVSEMVEQASNFLRRMGRVSYRALQREFALDEKDLADLKEELLFSHPQVADERAAVSSGLFVSGSVPMSCGWI
jgi:hypothetical protein